MELDTGRAVPEATARWLSVHSRLSAMNVMPFNTMYCVAKETCVGVSIVAPCHWRLLYPGCALMWHPSGTEQDLDHALIGNGHDATMSSQLWFCAIRP